MAAQASQLQSSLAVSLAVEVQQAIQAQLGGGAPAKREASAQLEGGSHKASRLGSPTKQG
eukprot:3460836-Alexandrium_andersonii.AAC.1